jgi:hypothetical protein
MYVHGSSPRFFWIAGIPLGLPPSFPFSRLDFCLASDLDDPPLRPRAAAALLLVFSSLIAFFTVIFMFCSSCLFIY